MKKHSDFRPNTLSNRALFSTYTANQPANMNNHNTHRQTQRPGTAGHPAVFIPGSATTAPPGLSTEFMWECVYDKLPSFQVPQQQEHFVNKEKKTRAMELDVGIDGSGRKHFPPQFDHVASALDGYPDARYTRYASANPQRSKEYSRDRERGRVKKMWRDAQLDSSASVSAADLKAEMDQWRQMEAESGGRRSGQQKWTPGMSADAVVARHQDEVSKIGYGRAGKGGMVEPLWYEPQVFPSDPRMQKYAHERNVADIGGADTRTAQEFVAELTQKLGDAQEKRELAPEADKPVSHAVPERQSITAGRLPPINNRTSLTANTKLLSNPLDQDALLFHTQPSQAPVEPKEPIEHSDKRVTTASERNVATLLPSSNHTSRYIYHAHAQGQQQSHQQTVTNIQKPNQATLTAAAPSNQGPSDNTSPDKESTDRIPSRKKTDDAPRHRDHRRVASARTFREQDHQQAKGASKRNAAIEAVKKTLNFGFAGNETPSQLESSASVAVYDEKEMRRIMAIYGMRILNGPSEPRFDAITSLTARLLNSDICAITIVDSTVVRFWSICDNTNGKYFSSLAASDPSLLTEVRSDSFCQYTIRDGEEKTHNGFVVLDASREPKFKNRPFVQKGLHFYAGAPLVTRAGIKIGALSIRGPARHQFTSQEAKILRQMTEWAVGELELYIAKRELDFRESLRLAQFRLGEVREGLCRGGWSSGRGILKESIDIIKNAMKLKNVAILKIRTTARAMRSTVLVLSEKCDIKPGDEKFAELCQATLDKPGQGPYILDRSLSVASQLQVCRYIGENVRQSASELIWSHGRPVGVLVFFFEGLHKTVSPVEEQFLASSAVTISGIWEHMETHDALAKVLSPTKDVQLLSTKLKSMTVVAGNNSAQAPLHGTMTHHGKFNDATSSNSSLYRPTSKSPFHRLPRKDTSFTSRSISTLRQSENSLHQTGSQGSTEPLGLFMSVAFFEPVIPAVKGNTVSEACKTMAESISKGYGTAASVSSPASPFVGSGSVNTINHGSIASIRTPSLLSKSTESFREKGKQIPADPNTTSNGTGMDSAKRRSSSIKSKYRAKFGMDSGISGDSRSRFKSNGSRQQPGSRENDVMGPLDMDAGIWGGTSAPISLTPKGAIDLFNDFSEMFEVVAEQRGIKCLKRYGNICMAVAGLSNDSVTCNNLIQMAVDLSQTLAEYSQETGIDVKARIGIHGDFIPCETSETRDGLERAWTSLGAFCSMTLNPFISSSLTHSPYRQSILDTIWNATLIL
ncbi:hypothetical protein HDU81_011099 [Chytriomyces hyalinus]|nr:hypothetical protein HDU81_011099 [Chytriomyces hyalinus]